MQSCGSTDSPHSCPSWTGSPDLFHSLYCLPPFWGNLFLSYIIIYYYIKKKKKKKKTEMLHVLGEQTGMKTDLYKTNVKSQWFIYRASFQHRLH